MNKNSPFETVLLKELTAMRTRLQKCEKNMVRINSEIRVKKNTINKNYVANTPRRSTRAKKMTRKQMLSKLYH